MAYLGKYISKKTGKFTWQVQFRKRVYEKDRKVKKDLTYSATFPSEEAAKEFIDEYEHIFFLQEPGETQYDSLMERRKRRFRHKIKDQN